MSSAPTFSIEFFPPKDQIGEERLWGALSELQELSPDFVSVTYGAGGSTRDRTIRVTSEITSRSGIPTREELISILQQYARSGITSILALRGDPQGGPSAPWTPTVGGLNHADELVSLACEMNFEVGVAAFPDTHPASGGNFAQDLAVLLEKERRGATFATTQFFFDAKRYFNLVEALRNLGSKLDVYPGILPITNVSQLTRMAELSGTPIPATIHQRILEAGDDPVRVKATGIEIAVELSTQLLNGGVPGLHFYTMNSATSTLEIIKRAGLR
jgi:methylenetetrahydrofolate reductase (NADPH)